MSMPTPGPWRVTVDGPPQVRCVTHTVCDITGARSNPQAMADARLVSAAPDLLSACEALLAETSEPFSALVASQARAAVKKAKGNE